MCSSMQSIGGRVKRRFGEPLCLHLGSFVCTNGAGIFAGSGSLFRCCAQGTAGCWRLDVPLRCSKGVPKFLCDLHCCVAAGRRRGSRRGLQPTRARKCRRCGRHPSRRSCSKREECLERLFFPNLRIVLAPFRSTSLGRRRLRPAVDLPHRARLSMPRQNIAAGE